MSYRYSVVKKEKRAKKLAAAIEAGALTEDDIKDMKRYRRDIKTGKLPRFMFTKGEDERPVKDKTKFMVNRKGDLVEVKHGLPLTLQSTFATLTKK